MQHALSFYRRSWKVNRKVFLIYTSFRLELKIIKFNIWNKVSMFIKESVGQPNRKKSDLN